MTYIPEDGQITIMRNGVQRRELRASFGVLRAYFGGVISLAEADVACSAVRSGRVSRSERITFSRGSCSPQG